MTAIVELLGGWRATAFAVIALFALSATGVQSLRVRGAEAAMTAHLAADAKATADAQIAARTQEYEAAVASAKVAADYEKAKQDAQAKSDSLIADLRAGTVKLRDRWNACKASVSAIGAAASEPDAAAADRAASAERIVRAAADADALIRALQDYIRTERAPAK